MSGLSLEFHAHKFKGHVILDTLLFEEILTGHVRTVPINMPVKFEVHSFNHFGAISI